MRDAELEGLLSQSAEAERQRFSSNDFQRQVLAALPEQQERWLRWLPGLAVVCAVLISTTMLTGLPSLGGALETQLLLPLGGGVHEAVTGLLAAFGPLGTAVSGVPPWVGLLLPFAVLWAWSYVTD